MIIGQADRRHLELPEGGRLLVLHPLHQQQALPDHAVLVAEVVPASPALLSPGLGGLQEDGRCRGAAAGHQGRHPPAGPQPTRHPELIQGELGHLAQGHRLLDEPGGQGQAPPTGDDQRHPGGEGVHVFPVQERPSGELAEALAVIGHGHDQGVLESPPGLQPGQQGADAGVHLPDLGLVEAPESREVGAVQALEVEVPAHHVSGLPGAAAERRIGVVGVEVVGPEEQRPVCRSPVDRCEGPGRHLGGAVLGALAGEAVVVAVEATVQAQAAAQHRRGDHGLGGPPLVRQHLGQGGVVGSQGDAVEGHPVAVGIQPREQRGVGALGARGVAEGAAEAHAGGRQRVEGGGVAVGAAVGPESVRPGRVQGQQDQRRRRDRGRFLRLVCGLRCAAATRWNQQKKWQVPTHT